MVGDRVLRPRLRLCPGGDYLSGWIVGAYLAEGHLRKDAQNIVCFSVANSEAAYLVGRLNEWAQIQGLEKHHHLSSGPVARCVDDKRSRGCSVYFCHPALRELLREWVSGNSAGTKHLAKLPSGVEFARGIWEGWIWGDGYESEFKRTGRTYKMSSATTVSPALAHQMQMVGGSLGFPSPLRYDAGGALARLNGELRSLPAYYRVGANEQRRMIWKRSAVAQAKVYRLRADGMPMQQIAAEVGLSYLTVWRWLHSKINKCHGLQVEVLDDCLAHKVTSVSLVPYKGQVYDIEVAEDHTFCAGAIGVSNSWSEIVYKLRKGPDQKDARYQSKYDDNRIGWRKFGPRDQNSLWDWELDEHGGCQGMVQIDQGEPRTIPIEKSLHFTTKPAMGNPEGDSVLRGCYRAWFLKYRIEDIEVIGIERDLAGLPQIIAPEKKDIFNDGLPEMVALRAKLEKIVTAIRIDEQMGVVLPHGYELKLTSTGGRHAIDTNTTIGRLNGDIARRVLAQFIMLGSGKTGSWALADVQKEVFMIALEGWLDRIAEVINNFGVKRLFDMNTFELDENPTIMPSSLREPRLQELAEPIARLAQAGIIIPDEELDKYIRELGGLPERKEEEGKSGEVKRSGDGDAGVSDLG